MISGTVTRRGAGQLGTAGRKLPGGGHAATFGLKVQ